MMNIEYINKITQKYIFIIFMFYYFYFFYFCSHAHNQTSAKYFRPKSCESCFFILFAVMMYVWPDGKGEKSGDVTPSEAECSTPCFCLYYYWNALCAFFSTLFYCGVCILFWCP